MTKIKMIKALSIAQPWAECIVAKGKNVENRSWNTKKRGYIAVHASAAYDKDRFEYCYEDYRLRIDPDSLPYGAIVGFAEIIDVVTEETLGRKTKKWFSGQYGFVLGNIIKLKTPVKAKGSLGFWKLKGKTLDKCLEQLSRDNSKKVSSRLLE